MNRPVVRVLGLLIPLMALSAATASAASASAHARPIAKLYLPDVFAVSRQAVTVPGRPVHVTGVVRPYVAGQRVVVRAFLGGRLIRRELLRVKPAPSGRYGRFVAVVRSPGPGTVSVVAVHKRTAAMPGLKLRRAYAVLQPTAAPGSSGLFVRLIQRRLAALHFYISQTGVYDSGTELAIDAYHRLLGWGTYKTLDPGTVAYLLNGWGQFKVRFPHHGRHVEGNLGNQLVALIDGANVEEIFPISSGKPSTPTVLGDFHVYSRVAGYLPDGMYYSDFFIGGYALHGYDPAPDYPASHGCLRLPIADAIAAYDWLAIGDWVDVYY